MIAGMSPVIAFTGAGISVESGIPPFRGEGGLWSKYDPRLLELDYFHSHPEKSWKVIKEVFYDFISHASFNDAHKVLAEMEEAGKLSCVITQNIDNLHQAAGTKKIFEFHGNSQELICISCQRIIPVTETDFTIIPPRCNHCKGLLKPNFIFFGEGIPKNAYEGSFEATGNAAVILVVGTTGEVMPAAQVPYLAKQSGAVVIEINTEPSRYTPFITDIYIEGKATVALRELWNAVQLYT